MNPMQRAELGTPRTRKLRRKLNRKRSIAATINTWRNLANKKP